MLSDSSSLLPPPPTCFKVSPHQRHRHALRLASLDGRGNGGAKGLEGRGPPGRGHRQLGGGAQAHHRHVLGSLPARAHRLAGALRHRQRGQGTSGARCWPSTTGRMPAAAQQGPDAMPATRQRGAASSEPPTPLTALPLNSCRVTTSAMAPPSAASREASSSLLMVALSSGWMGAQGVPQHLAACRTLIQAMQSRTGARPLAPFCQAVLLSALTRRLEGLLTHTQHQQVALEVGGGRGGGGDGHITWLQRHLRGAGQEHRRASPGMLSWTATEHQ